MTWLILFGLWPAVWIAWRWFAPNTTNCRRPVEENIAPSDSQLQPPACQMVAILTVALYVINLGYVFDGFATPLAEFQFVSSLLTGSATPGIQGNRFETMFLGYVPVPLPKQYVLGFDSQKKDLENYPDMSYLHGEWRHTGWWYYYLYGLLVKVPCGIWSVFAFVVASRFICRHRRVPFRDELVLIAPALALLTVASTQSEINMHVRYVLPSLALLLIFVGQADSYAFTVSALSLSRIFILGSVVYSLVSLLLIYPHHLAYFNDFVGGSANGNKHLLGSNSDWGQDLLDLNHFLVSRTDVASGAVVKASYEPVHIGFCRTMVRKVDSSPIGVRVLVTHEKLLREESFSHRNSTSTAIEECLSDHGIPNHLLWTHQCVSISSRYLARSKHE